MVRKCERPSCRERGEVAYVIDTTNLFVMIDAPIPRDSSRVNILCRRHADSLVVPRDWQIIDNRMKRQRLFSAPAGPKPATVNKGKATRNKTTAVIQDLFDFATRVVAPPAPTPDSVHEFEAEFVAESTEFDGPLPARGNSLSRAFGGFDDSDIDHDQQHPEY